MSNTDILDRPDPRAALDAFSRSDERSNAVATTAPPFSAPAERIVGAQAVAVHRDETRVLGKLKALAAAAGGEWFYRFPVKNNREGRTDWVEGPSIKLANDLAREFGNCGVDTRVQDLGDAWLIYARFTDYETGFDMVRPFQQRKSQRSMKGDNDRALDIALQIGVSKAIRNVVVNALQTYADYAFEEARNSLVNRIGAELPKYREATARRLADHVDIKRVEAVIGRSAGEWLAPDVARVIAMMKAVTDGMASLDETFPPLAAATAGDKAAPEEKGKASVDQFAAGDEGEKQGAKPKAKKSESAKAAVTAPQAADADEAGAPGSIGEPPPNETVDEDTRQEPQQPLAPVMKTAGQYMGWVRSRIAEADDADGLEAWFRSDEQKQLRSKIGVMSDEVSELAAEVKTKAAMLRQAAED